MNKAMRLHRVLTTQILVNVHICSVINFHRVLQVYCIMQTTVWPKHVAGIKKINAFVIYKLLNYVGCIIVQFTLHPFPLHPPTPPNVLLVTL